MAGIQLSGIVSGIDTDSVIQQLLAADSAPLKTMSNEKTAAQTRAQALKDIETRLKNLQTSADDLRDILLWNPVQSVSSSNTDQFTVTATGGVAPGSHSIKVTQIARSSQDSYAWTPQASDSSMTVNGTTVAIPANASVDQVASTLNGNSALGVYAVNAGGKLVLTSRATGADASSTASGAGLTVDPSMHRAGLNAQGQLDGVAFDQASNTISAQTSSSPASGATTIAGLSITLKSPTTSDGNIEVGVPSLDTDAVKDKLQAFVDAYNDAIDFISAKVSEPEDPTTDGQGNAATTPPDPTKGVLFGDSGLQNILSSMRLAVSNPVIGTGLPNTMTMLSQLGISTGAASSSINADSVAGKLTFDVDQFTAAMATDPSSVQKLLGGVPGTDGFGQEFSDLLDPLTQVSGVLDQRVESTDDEISDLDDRMATLNDRLSQREDALRAQFTAMETAMAANQAQLAQLTSALGGTVASS
jgi:flagellar hook-associated protein 2